MIQTDKWSDYWTQEGTSGEVFVNKSGDRHPQLAAYWQTQLSGAHSTSRIIDLACGAGSVFADLDKHNDEHSYELFGADLSTDALQLFQRRLPSTKVIACSASQLPFPSEAFDLVVSQFGIEYAGANAFTEAGDLVARGGRIAILCHHQDGYIDSKNKRLLAGAHSATNSNFISAALDLVRSSFANQNSDQSMSKFNAAGEQLAATLKEYPEGIHHHLYFGFQQLFDRRSHYDESDIVDWLEAMRLDVDKNILRLTQMRQAARSEKEIRNICQMFTKQGLRKVGYSPFTISGNDLPVAWSITAERP
ncbi:MAG: class I SAM-dependent methyltransferase [Pseudomonadales bacterium]|jgi:ubiquinone/menaquinone biosynthesis C-methylase UbiE